ncbi:MAG: FAD-binding oxidoreductase, partial [Bacteriovorax sp.]
VCLNDDAVLLSTKNLNHYISFDKDLGIICCESGVSIDEILKLIVPHGWFIPVTPGTKFVTIGGALANDVHGKNHHLAGNFGHHVRQFELLRSNGNRLLCSRTQNSDLFFATIGGLGLTGLITWVEFNLKKISSAWIEQEQIQFRNLDEFFHLTLESEIDFEYTVSWVDCINSKDNIRGLFIRGNHAKPQKDNFRVHKANSVKNIPIDFPNIALNKFTIKLFNHLYFRKNLDSFKSNVVHYDSFFYPLDSIKNWNRIYGKRGFLQYQFIIPHKNDNGRALAQIFNILQSSQMGSFLAILKTFSQKPSDGMLSFPKEGVTLALDFPNYGERLFNILKECDEIVRHVGGRIYPAKDARMSQEIFYAGYPRINEFKLNIDPQFSSSFWRRVR